MHSFIFYSFPRYFRGCRTHSFIHSFSIHSPDTSGDVVHIRSFIFYSFPRPFRRYRTHTFINFLLLIIFNILHFLISYPYSTFISWLLCLDTTFGILRNFFFSVYQLVHPPPSPSYTEYTFYIFLVSNSIKKFLEFCNQ